MEKLEQLRKDAGFSQREFSSQLGLAQSTYCQYETGKRAIPAKTVERICSILGVEEQQIFLPKLFTFRE